MSDGLSETTRRGFLAALFGAAAWQFMPTGPMCWPAASSTMVTPDWVLREVGRLYASSLASVAFANQTYAARVGDAVNVRLNG